ncbi:flagellar hook-basal body complex protein [Sporolactobacillus inulinus]|jgi:flagellar hook protein FlgE|uniref:Flagellar hook protein FlgE n=2 Tax=Sporolactobacillus inulinus TaxID=2078 RepID=A0A4Y3T379_9BACL|nr:flagellar hook-basal body complex protein [Sporolactobacillus inulinus]KLI01816.1 flagellar basal body rod protein FlgG [Sporolactobacillus inulinus CASD]GAY74545.1 flagellar hook protein FlgE [Sporolactobacillus inulinus]GEB75903.1 flagellar basal-body rod protein FlgG [Sporolactobacillus inulinus]
MLLRSLGSGVSGLKNFQTSLDVIGNNISNVSTTGYKKARVNFEDLFSNNVQSAKTDQNAIQVGLGAQAGSIDNIITNGVANPTGNPYDVAINGEGYFQVTNGGNTYYTRAGDFKLSSDGESLVNAQGYTLSLDFTARGTVDGHPATFNDVSAFTINNQGVILGTPKSNSETSVNLGRIQAYTFNNPAGLEKVGNSLYQTSQASGAANGNRDTNGQGDFVQNALEGSNVDLTDEMTALIEAQRAYQANARTITTADQILQELVQLKR